jgi:hypothetical protein
MRDALRVLAMVGVLMGTGCASQQSVRWSPDAVTPTSYQRTLKQWTRAAVAYDTIESRFFVTATCLSPKFNAAYIQERTRVGGLSGDEITLLTKERARQEDEGITFFVAVAAQNPRWNDLDHPRPSLGVRLFIDEGGPAIKPKRITRMSEDQLADFRPYFRYADRLRTGYLIVFPPQARMDQLRLRIGGAPGMVQLRWLTAK